jgi:hypothetical protein
VTAPAQQLSLLDQFVPPAPGDKLFDELVAIAIRLERRPDVTGVTVGEVVFEYEKTTKKQVGGIPMSDKTKEQRQTSWLPRIMKAAGFSATDYTRRSPVARHHAHRHTVWVSPSAEDRQR